MRLLIYVLLLALAPSQYVYEKVSMKMITRTTRKGLMTTLKADVFYKADGRMVSHYTEPDELVVSNDKKGDMTVYSVSKNTVTQKNNFMFGTDQNQLFFFLEKNKADLGLSTMGFTLKNTRFEDGLKITEWIPPANLIKQLLKAEVAHEKNNPVFLGYFDIKGRVIKKVYFTNYTHVASHHFPANITQITFENAKDSIISKTTYSDFKLDEAVSDEFLNFKIPANAKQN